MFSSFHRKFRRFELKAPRSPAPMSDPHPKLPRMDSPHTSILQWRGDSGIARRAMSGIGILTGDESPWCHVNIEEALILGSLHIIERHDTEMGALLKSWFSMHHERVISRRLETLVKAERNAALFKLWGELALLGHTHPRNRFDRLSRPKSPAPAKVRVPQSMNVMSSRELAGHHLGYFYRVLLGASARADAFAALRLASDLTPAQIARVVHCSASTAWQARRDFDLTRQQDW